MGCGGLGILGVGPPRLNPGAFSLARLGCQLDSVDELASAIEQRLCVPRPTRLLNDRVPLTEALPPLGWAGGSTYARFVQAYASVCDANADHISNVSGRPEGHSMNMDGRTDEYGMCVDGRPEGQRMNMDEMPEGQRVHLNIDAKRAVRRHMQRRLVGYARHMIYMAQDFIATFCMEDERGYFLEADKRLLCRMNKAMLPWTDLLGTVTSHKYLWKIRSLRGNNPLDHWDEDDAIVYVRVNLVDGNMYIGETKNFDQRVKAHFVATSKHRIGAVLSCRGCRDHRKYKRHQTVRPSEWITIPMVLTTERYIAKRMERTLIRTWKPSLNAEDKAFWLLNKRYTGVYKPGPRERAHNKKPWHTLAKRATRGVTCDCYPMYTTYACHGQLVHDLGAIVKQKELHHEAIHIDVYPGRKDLTRWRRLRKYYGASKVHITDDGGTEFRGLLEDWRDASMRMHHMRIRIFRTEKVNRTAFKEIVTTERALRNADEDTLAFFWRVRNDKVLNKDVKYAVMVMRECEYRYTNFSATHISIRIPFFKQLDVRKVKHTVMTQIEKMPWPPFLREWHKRNIKVIAANQPNISDILSNVNKPWSWQGGGTCKCAEIQRARGPHTLPMVEGHIFFTNRDYTGKHARALQYGANNIPQQTEWDLKRAWHSIGQNLPECLRVDPSTWDEKLQQCRSATKRDGAKFATTKDVYTLRRDLRGLTIGPLDKNPNELWFCCHTLYKKAWDKCYGCNAGYEQIFPKKYVKNARACRRVYETTIPAPTRRGTYKDIIKWWEQIYKVNQWHRYARYDTKGGFATPYILFKDKNVHLSKRATNWAKARPIAPATKHPMKRLFTLTGRAWAHITNNLVSDNFIIQHGGQVPEFLWEAEHKLSHKGAIKCVIKDIEGCFPNMDKDAIRQGLREELLRITTATGYDAITVPRHKATKCTLATTNKRGDVRIPFEDLLDIMEFALDNTIMMDHIGQLWRQVKGIPMGDPHSPGMTIGTCAWMEHKWINTLTPNIRDKFLAKRYMDDILLFYVENEDFDHERLISEFSESRCYLPPLRLEDGGIDTFLETTFEITPQNSIRHWLKNENQPGKPPKVWRYAHYESHGEFYRKMGVIMACLKKVHQMASDPLARQRSAHWKLAEFRHLGYPHKMLWRACTTMAVNTRDTTWFRIRHDNDQCSRRAHA